MVLAKLFPSEIHALHLQVETREFMKEWKTCIQEPKHDMGNLLKILEPYIIHWYNLLTNSSYPRDVQIATLYRCLDKYDYGGLEIVNTWITQVNNLKAELQYIACEVIRHTQYFPNAAKPIMAEYIFALLYRNYLRDHIKRELNLDPIVVTDDETILTSQTIEYDNCDILLLESVTTNRWERYLLYLISNGFSTNEIANIAKLPRETFYYEEKHLWEQLKNLWQIQEL
jgi:hypothetical protein